MRSSARRPKPCLPSWVMNQADSPRLVCHPATALLLWLFFIVWLQWVDGRALLSAGVLLLPLLIRAGWRQWLRYLRRSRWLLLVIGAVEALSMPGQPLWRIGPFDGPGRAGLSEAAEADGRLMLLLLALALCMARMTRDDWLLAIYTLLSPLARIGVPVERLTARIGLTLQHAEALLGDQQQMSWRGRLTQLLDETENDRAPAGRIVLPQRAFGPADGVCLIGAVLTGFLVVWVWQN